MVSPLHVLVGCQPKKQCSAFAQRPAGDRQGLDDDEIRHRESSAEILARTTHELEELRSENEELRKRALPASSTVGMEDFHTRTVDALTALDSARMDWYAEMFSLVSSSSETS